MNGWRGLIGALALVVAAPGLGWAGEVDVVGVDNVSMTEPCVVGDIEVASVDDGSVYTGFTITNPAATADCATFVRYIYVRAMYDSTGDGEADGAYYMAVPAEVYAGSPLGVFGGSPPVWSDNTYKTKVHVGPPVSVTFVRYYAMVNSKRDEITP